MSNQLNFVRDALHRINPIARQQVSEVVLPLVSIMEQLIERVTLLEKEAGNGKG